MQEPIRQAKRHSQAFAGVILIVVGLLFLVDRMGWEWGWQLSFGRMWPVLLIVIGLGIMFSHESGEVTAKRMDDGTVLHDVRPRGRRRFGDGIFVLLAGVLMLLHMNRLMPLSHSWPLFIVAGGLSMMFSSRGRGRRARGEMR